MTFDSFKDSLNQPAAPAEVSAELRALWFDAVGDWDEAHRIVQDRESVAGAWVHAYLHRKEGDESNAGYWYRRAGKVPFRGSLDEEWEQIARALL